MTEIPTGEKPERLHTFYSEDRCCDACNNYSYFDRVLKDQTTTIKGVPITQLTLVSVCKMCGKEVFDMEIDSLYQERLYHIYEEMTGEKLPGYQKAEHIKK